jgi:hypothetical protein
MHIKPIRDPWWCEQASNGIGTLIKTRSVWATDELIRAIKKHVGARGAGRDTLAINILAALEGELITWDREARLWKTT